MTRRDVNEGDVFRKGFATNALEKGATEGQIPAVGADGEMAFANAGGGSQPEAPLALTGTDLNTTPLTVTGAPGQDGDIFRAESNDGTAGVEVSGDDANGVFAASLAGARVILGNNACDVVRFGQKATEPADGLLGASTFALWLDDTPGATKLKIKAKDSGGTVRTGSINLT